MTRLRAGVVRTGVAAVAASALLALLFTPSAGAADAPTVTIDSPGGAVGNPGVTIAGHATMHELAGLRTNWVTRVSISLSSSKHPGPLPSCGSCMGGGSGFSVPFSWSPPALAWNGPYRVTVTAWGQEAVDINGEESSTATRDFAVAAPAATPKNVATTVNPDRTVIVTWAKNTEPDLIGYRVQRKAPGADVFEDATNAVLRETTLHDPVPAAGAGGAYVYRVQAIRPGASGGPSDAIVSAFSAADAQVLGADGQPVPPDGPPGSAPPGAGPGAAPASAPPDLRGFLGGGGGGGGPRSSGVNLPKLPGQPDAGFDANLPYPDGQKRKGVKGAVQTITMGTAGLASNPRALAVPLAAGLVLFMASFHLRLLSRRMDEGSPVRQ